MPTTVAPEPMTYLVPAFIRDQFMMGDCAHLAHALAVRNPGWGVLVVGDAYLDEDGFWHSETIQHAWAVRPDGALVDIEGVHPRTVAEDRATRCASEIHEHTGPTAAAEADEVWAVTVMDLCGSEDPDDAALWVMENWGNAPVGTLCTINETDTDPDYDPAWDEDEDF